MHYVWHRSENKHGTSLPPLLPSLTPGDIVYLVYTSAWLRGLGESVCCLLLLPLAKITDSEAQTAGTVRSLFFSWMLHFTAPNQKPPVRARHDIRTRKGGMGKHVQ